MRHLPTANETQKQLEAVDRAIAEIKSIKNDRIDICTELALKELEAYRKCVVYDLQNARHWEFEDSQPYYGG